MTRRQVLIWKLEDGPEDAGEDGDPNDVGPAWIDTYEDDTHVSEEKVAGGEWITRAEAHRLAEANGYDLMEDDGRGDPATDAEHDASSVASVDVEAINAKLRAAGITEDELLVERLKGGFLAVTGSLADNDLPSGLRSPPDELEGLVFRSMRMPSNATELCELLDDLAPTWRQNEG